MLSSTKIKTILVRTAWRESRRRSIYLKLLIIFIASNAAARAAELASPVVEEESDAETVDEDQIQKLRLQTRSEDVHIWDRYVRKFRRGHHLTVISGWNRGLWRVGSFGRLKNEDFKSEGVDSSVQYAFHLQLISKFGYYLGSSAGYYAEMRERNDEDFGPSSMWKLPGIVAGLVYNYDATGRIFAGGEAYLSRVVRLETRDESGESQTIAVTGETFDAMFGWDKFVSLSWGVRFQCMGRWMWVPAPRESESKPVDARIRRTSQTYSVGTIYHFL